jgi:tripartite-type tricarboxylate transporter receptor subunit TctC
MQRVAEPGDRRRAIDDAIQRASDRRRIMATNPARTAFVAATILAAASLIAPAASADAVRDFYKDRTVSVVIGFGPGGGADEFAQYFARHLAKFIPGLPNVIVQHMPGAGGLTALGSLYNAGPFDGTRIMLTSPSHSLAQITGSKSVRYDLLKMNVIGTLTRDTQACAASGRSGVRSITEASSKELIVGATGANSSAAQHARLLANLLGYKLRIITGYQGTAQMRLAMETGEVSAACALWASQALGPQKQDYASGRLVPIVQMGSKPHPVFGKAPVVYDLAKDDEQRRIMRVVFGTTELSRPVVAPPNVPAERVAALRDAFWKALHSPDAKADAKRLKLIIDPLDWKHTTDELREVMSMPKAIVDRARKDMNP